MSTNIDIDMLQKVAEVFARKNQALLGLHVNEVSRDPVFQGPFIGNAIPQMAV